MTRIPNYAHLPGWKEIIDRLIQAIDDLRGGNEFTFFEIKEKYGSLRVDIDWASGVPVDVIDQIESLINQAETLSESTCIDCGSPALLHDWNGDWYLPCCPAHARIRARNWISGYRGDDWILGDDFKIYDLEHCPITPPIAASIDEKLHGSAAETWRAAKWLSKE